MSNMEPTLEESIFVKNILQRAAQRLSVDLNLVRIEYGGIGNGFDTIENGAKTGSSPYLRIEINLDWLRFFMEKNDNTTLLDILYHEIRHIYQFIEIENYNNSCTIRESRNSINRWIYERANYIPYSSYDTTNHFAHFSQFIELDAMAFSIILRSIDSETNPNIETGVAIPKEVYPLLDDIIDKVASDLGLSRAV